jgi:hypothetical protein
MVFFLSPGKELQKLQERKVTSRPSRLSGFKYLNISQLFAVEKVGMTPV